MNGLRRPHSLHVTLLTKASFGDYADPWIPYMIGLLKGLTMFSILVVDHFEVRDNGLIFH